MKIDIENINKFEKRSKVDTTQWRKCCKVTEEDHFKEYDTFPDDLYKNVRIIHDKSKGFEIHCRK